MTNDYASSLSSRSLRVHASNSFKIISNLHFSPHTIIINIYIRNSVLRIESKEE